jgi:hypothetical protein
MNRQDYIVQQFKYTNPITNDRKALCKAFVQFVKQYGHDITSRQADRILNLYNGLADLSIHKGKRYYATVIE